MRQPYNHEYNITSSKDLSGTVTTATISGTLKPHGTPGGGSTSGSDLTPKRKLTASELAERYNDCQIVSLWAQAEAERYMFRIEDHDYGRIGAVPFGTMVNYNDSRGWAPMTDGARYFTTKRN